MGGRAGSTCMVEKAKSAAAAVLAAAEAAMARGGGAGGVGASTLVVHISGVNSGMGPSHPVCQSSAWHHSWALANVVALKQNMVHGFKGGGSGRGGGGGELGEGGSKGGAGGGGDVGGGMNVYVFSPLHTQHAISASAPTPNRRRVLVHSDAGSRRTSSQVVAAVSLAPNQKLSSLQGGEGAGGGGGSGSGLCGGGKGEGGEGGSPGGGEGGGGGVGAGEGGGGEGGGDGGDGGGFGYPLYATATPV